jgi:transcriptional regulator
MYSLPYFKTTDHAEMVAFMKAHPFATLCGSYANGLPVATHLPVLITHDGDDILLTGHIMRKTDHHLAFGENPEGLVIFHGPHVYVSASWYSDKQQGSTWNYMTVHARGKVEFRDTAHLYKVLEDLTAHFENDQNSPSLMKHLSDDYVSRMSKAIVSFEIRIESLDNVFKLSQNRDRESFISIIEKLESADDSDAKKIAGEMKQRFASLYENK